MIKPKAHFLFAILVMILAALACGSLEEAANQNEAPQPLAREFSRCDGKKYLALYDEIVEQTLNDLGTSACWYKLTITNTSTETTIGPVVYNWHEDGYQNVKEGKWEALISLGPGESVEWTGNYTTFTDPDAKGPLMNDARYIAGVIDSPDCASLRFNNDYLQTPALTTQLFNPCKPDEPDE